MEFLVDIATSLTTVLVVIVSASYLFFKWRYRYWSERNVPHKKPVFPFGNFHSLKTKTIGHVFKEMYDEFRNERFIGIWMAQNPGVMFIDTDLIKRVMITDFMHWTDHGGYINEETDPLSAHLFSLGGAKWRNLRAKLAPVFTTGKMKMIFPIIVERAEQLIQVLQGPAERGEVIEAKEVMTRYTTDVIASAAFGIEANSLNDPDAMFRKMGMKISSPDSNVMFKMFFSVTFPKLANMMKMAVNPKDVSDFFIGAIRDTIAYREANNLQRNDILQLLMQLKDKGYVEDVDTKNKSDENNENWFTVNLAAAQAFVFFQGGFETSSTTLQYALYELSLNQELQEKVRQEIKQVLAKHEGKLTYDSVNGMDLVGRVIDEILRKYPPVAALMRQCTRDYIIPDTDVLIRKDIFAMLPIYGLHMDERYYPDPEKFDPERFTEEEKRTRPHFAYLPFGGGPRLCIGQRFGLMQARVGLVAILVNYRFQVCDQTPKTLVFDPKSFVFAPEGGMNLKITALEF